MMAADITSNVLISLILRKLDLDSCPEGEHHDGCSYLHLYWVIGYTSDQPASGLEMLCKSIKPRRSLSSRILTLVSQQWLIPQVHCGTPQSISGLTQFLIALDVANISIAKLWRDQ